MYLKQWMSSHFVTHSHIQASQRGLTTSENVWILPTYYNPQWWVLDEEELSQLSFEESCSNEELVDILNSAIFLEPFKYPRLGSYVSHHLTHGFVIEHFKQ